MGKSALIVDDSYSERKFIRETLKKRGLFTTLFEAENGLEALQVLNRERIDLVISDILMPKMDGLKFLNLIKGEKELMDIPVIMLTIKGETFDKVKGLEIGADDYIVKPVNPEEFTAKIKAILRIKELQDDLKARNQLLERLAVLDGLTELYNQGYFYKYLKFEFKRSQRYTFPISCMMIDADSFKDINDIYGHRVGDKVLRELAFILQQAVREHDFVARYGGDEFAIILPQTNRKGARIVANRIVNEVKRHRFNIDSKTIHVTVSIGIAASPSNKIKTYDDLVKLADKALYDSKAKGGICIARLRSNGERSIKKVGRAKKAYKV